MSSNKFASRDILIFSAVIVVFVAASILSQRYVAPIKQLIQVPGVLGMTIYVFLAIISNVIAPLTVLPLLPVAVALWGSFATALLSILGWTIGAAIIFSLTRRYGKPFVSRFINISRVEEINKAIPQKNFFWIVVFFRIIFPVDILSFALGLFTSMPWQPYLAATIIGITPFAFILSFGVSLPIIWQIIIAVVLLTATLFLYARARNQIFSWLGNKNKN